MDSWPGAIAAITLFTDDLEATKAFYLEVFGLPVHFEDEASCVFAFAGTLVNLLRAADASELVAPAEIGTAENGPRMQFTLAVDDVDGMCDELRRRGVVLLNGPVDRPWGIRTASFRDPAGFVWEIAT